MNITENIHCGADVPTVEVREYSEHYPSFVIVAFGESGKVDEPPARFSFFFDSLDAVHELSDALVSAIHAAQEMP